MGFIEQETVLINRDSGTDKDTWQDVVGTARAICYIDPARYVNPTFFFEAVLGVDCYARLVWFNPATGLWEEVPNSVLYVTTTKLVRSGSLNLTAGEYKVQIKSPELGKGVKILFGKIIIIDEYTTLTKTESQPRICGYGSTISTTFKDVRLTRIYFLDETKFDGTLTYYFEAVCHAPDGKAIEVRLYDKTAGAPVAGSLVSTNSTEPVRLRSGAITLTAEHEYIVQIRTTLRDKWVVVDMCRLIIVQEAPEITKTQVEKCFGLYFNTDSGRWWGLYIKTLYDRAKFAGWKIKAWYELTTECDVPDQYAPAKHRIWNQTDETTLLEIDHIGDPEMVIFRKRVEIPVLLSTKEYRNQAKTGVVGADIIDRHASIILDLTPLPPIIGYLDGLVCIA